jgi:hypothetical protein
MTRPRTWKFYAMLWIAMIALRQACWHLDAPWLLFGVLPVGLAGQVACTLVAVLVIALLVRYDWPADLEELEPRAPKDGRSGSHPA